MKRYFSTKLLTIVLIAVCVGVLLVAVGCVEKNPPNTAEYTITFDTGVDGLTVQPIVAKAGAQIAEPKPQREGYRFGGWTLGGKPYVFDTMPEKNITLVATWVKLYSVTFVTGTADVLPTAWYVPGETIEQPQLTREGHTLVAWTLDGKPYEFGAMPAYNLTLTALWQASVTITFDTGSDDFTVEPIVGAAGTKISAPVVHRRGYYLQYWMLNGVRYEFTVMPEESITLVAKWMELTNLPAMFIDLADKNNNPIPITSVTRETAVSSTITLTNTDDQYLLTSLKADFKGRGHGSWNEAKKSYKIKFDKKQSLFGREKNKHWVIVACANFDDVTMSRNYLAYNMANEVFDNIEYATPAYWIEVYVNGEYHGVYLLCEHVRVGEGRLDINSVYGVENTGYLVEYDSYATGEEGVDYFRVDGVKYPFTVHSPDPEDYATDGNITKAEYMKQVAYIKDYVTRVYHAAYTHDYTTFSQLVDTASFVDMYILHELFKNVDTGWSSFYLYKKPNGKLYAGPVWDFDGTTTAAADRGGAGTQGLYVASVDQTPPYTYASELFIELYKTSGFRNTVKTRWKELSPNIRVFLDERLNDRVYEENKVAMGKNFVKWKNKTQSAAETDWVNDAKSIKTWLMYRIVWLDATW